MSIETPDFQAMDMAKLRQYATHLKLQLARTDKKEDIIEKILNKLDGKVVPEFAEQHTRVKPGYAKIRILEDGTPGASNPPVYVFHNGYTCLMPRGIDLIVPQKVVRVLNDATVMRRKQEIVSNADGSQQFKERTVPTLSYPFQILEMVPGPEVLSVQDEAKRKTMGPRRKYRKLFGKWPRPRELARAIEQGFIKLGDDEQLPDQVVGLIEDIREE